MSQQSPIRITLRQGGVEVCGEAFHPMDDPAGERVVTGLNGEVVIIPAGNVAAIVMSQEIAEELFARTPH